MARKGQAIFLVYTDLSDPQYEEEFNAWYNTEHLPELLALPGVLDAARYVAVRGGPKYLAAYELESVNAMQTPEFKNRPRTPWGQRVSPTAIGKNRARIVGQQIFPDGAAQRARAVAAHFVSQSECHISPHTARIVTKIQSMPARVPEAPCPVKGIFTRPGSGQSPSAPLKLSPGRRGERRERRPFPGSA